MRRTVRDRCDCTDNVWTVRRTRVDENDARGQGATHRLQTDLFRLMYCDRCVAHLHSPHLWVKLSPRAGGFRRGWIVTSAFARIATKCTSIYYPYFYKKRADETIVSSAPVRSDFLLKKYLPATRFGQHLSRLIHQPTSQCYSLDPTHHAPPGKRCPSRFT